jgi:hypothetical protein
MIRAGDEPVGQVQVSVTEPVPAERSKQPKMMENLKVFREWYTQVTRRSTSPIGHVGLGWFPDALVPADAPKHGLPIDVPSGKVQGIWVEFHISRHARAGKFNGIVTLTSAGKLLQTLPMQVNVYAFDLPVERHLRWRIGYSGFEGIADFYKIPHDSDEFLAMEQELYRMAWEDCRFVPTTHYGSPRPPTTGKGADLKIDWTSFDRRFGKYLDGSAFADHQPVNIFSLPVSPENGWPTGTRGKTKPEELDLAALRVATTQMARHWDENGWRLQDGFCYVADEPAPDRYEVIKAACKTIREADPRIATSVAFYTHFGKSAPELVTQFGGYVTMWDIAGNYMNLAALRPRIEAGDTVGFYQGSEPYQGSEALDADGLSLVTLPWIAWRYKLNHLFLYNMCEWDYFRLDRGKGKTVAWANGKRQIWENPLNQSWQTNSQGVLIYPGQYVGLKAAVPSIRLKQVRRGVQDYEYLWLLSRKDPKKANEIARRIIHKAIYEADGKFEESTAKGDWERDPRAWDTARREMAGLIEAK